MAERWGHPDIMPGDPRLQKRGFDHEAYNEKMEKARSKAIGEAIVSQMPSNDTFEQLPTEV